jgi:hypothetical protein
MAPNNGDYKTGRVYAFQRWILGILIALLPVLLRNKDNKIPVALAQTRLLTATLAVLNYRHRSHQFRRLYNRRRST